MKRNLAIFRDLLENLVLSAYMSCNNNLWKWAWYYALCIVAVDRDVKG